ncbi:S-adenosyl-L-methionine-dependent methyltransferase [Massariosphaeria phaeospora]|uniref:S-adenosyl-L-methionine-dependent methyltransferase n=1 Tax=Massariosphaeria phaeospora TaxID=100035 RepID=A0A7C8I078_9PLEO|nr:S-adenosyl-L-methionine-dependent methyltransferase [Massariosphaeria phaeospora]
MVDTNAELNREFHDAHAQGYNNQHASGIELLTEEIRSRVDWIGLPPSDKIRMLDYACGTGLISVALAPYVTETVGIDISPNMVEEYNKRAETDKIPMRAHAGNLVSDEEEPVVFSSPDFFAFDLVTIGLGFHHFSDPTLAAQRMAARLRCGGKLLIIDNVSDDNGFSHESAEKLFRDAGVATDFEFSVIDRELRIGRGPAAWKQKVFIARGTKTEL